jgi:hypothetical protein
MPFLPHQAVAGHGWIQGTRADRPQMPRIREEASGEHQQQQAIALRIQQPGF